MSRIKATEANLGAALRQARLDAGLTQAELASRAGVSRRFVLEVEAGKRPGAELGRVLAIIRALKLDLSMSPAAFGGFDEALKAVLGAST